MASPTIQIHTRQQCWARLGEHTSAGLGFGAAGAAAADAPETTTTAPAEDRGTEELHAVQRRLQLKT